MTTIKQNRVSSLTISFDKDFLGGNVLSQSSVSLNPISVPSDKNSIYLFVDFSFTCSAMTNDFELKSKLVLPFHLSNKQDIQKTDLYKCVEMTKERLQNIINATFAGQNPLIVSPIDFEEIADNIDDIFKRF